MGKLDTSKLVNLDEAPAPARRHVETLRLRVHSGSLEAVRGPHGAYYIVPSALEKLRGIRHVRPPGQVTSEIIERLWAVIEDSVDIGTRTLVRLIRGTQIGMSAYSLVSVHRLAAVGLSFKQIAGELGITAHHVRSLYRRCLPVELGKWARCQSTRRVSTRKARDLLAGLRAI